MIMLKLPEHNALISLQTDKQRTFLENEKERAKTDGALSFQWDALEKQGVDRSSPAPVSFLWSESWENDAETDARSYLLVSETEELRAPWVYETDRCACDVYNLKAGTRYYWCVQKNGRRSEVSSFQTAMDLPRCIKLENVSNVRDMGGYEVEEGRIRQGLVYRGGGFESPAQQIACSGLTELHRLGIRTELDMRGEVKDTVEYTTPEIIGIRRAYIPCVPYDKVFSKENRPCVKAFFKVFASKKNYPIYYHCWGGADRTGTFAFILGAFLGMRLQDLVDEYEFTTLAIWGIRTRNYGEFRDFLALFLALPGESLREKATHFLKTQGGLTDKQLSFLYDLLVEKS